METAGKILLGAAIVLAVLGAILFGLAKRIVFPATSSFAGETSRSMRRSV